MLSCQKKLLIISFIVISTFAIKAQTNRYQVTVTVVESKKNKPIPYASVVIEELQLGGITDEQGKIFIKRVPQGNYALLVSYLGYQKSRKLITISKNTSIMIHLNEESLELPQVEVMSSTKSKSGSTIIIDKTALEYIQPSSLGDVFQLLPGQLTTDGRMTTLSQATSRQASGDKNTALGTTILNNGIPMSNNANLQVIGVDQMFRKRHTVNKGLDLRLISTDHLQKVEIIQGVPSAKYGDLSSGVVITKPKSGKSPLEMRVKANPNSKLFYVGKGFMLPEKLGNIHVGMDYTDARPDVRESLTSFKRMSFQSNYSNILDVFGEKLDVGLIFSYTGTVDATKNDPDLTPRLDTYKANYNRFMLQHNGQWKPAKKWLSSLDYSVSYDVTHDVLERYMTVSPNGITPLPLSGKTGEYEGIYLPAEYMSDYRLEGIPTNFFAEMEGKSIFPIKKINHVVNWGAQYRYEKNNGTGFVYDILRPPFPSSSNSSRPRSFKAIPAMQHAAFYLEDKITGKQHKHEFELTIGGRWTTLPGLPNSYVNMHNKLFFEPRVNAWWKFPGFKIKEKNITISLKAGYGSAVKFPTLDMLYPNKTYDDFVSVNYFSQNRENAFLWMTTNVVENANAELRPNRNKKMEAGLDVNVESFSFSIVGFREISNQGFNYTTNYYTEMYNRYKTDKIFDHKPSISEFTQYLDTLLSVHAIPNNSERTIKTGFEYNLRTPVIPSLRTSVTINGAYYRTTYDVSQPIMEHPSIILHNKPYPYVGIYSWDSGNIKRQFNTNFWFNTHLPKQRLIFTTKIQSLWFYEYRQIPYSGIPESYFGIGKEKTPFNEEDRKDPLLRFLVHEFNSKAFATNRSPIEVSIDLKATKEITDNIKMSFYVNRLFFYSPSYRSVFNRLIKKRSSPYFGTELHLNF